MSNGDLRLADGRSALSGRLEVLYSGQWGTVCNDRFGRRDAFVACFQLGYEYGSAASYSSPSDMAGSGPIWMNRLRCEGDEARLADCRFDSNTWKCTHYDDVSLTCTGAQSPPPPPSPPSPPPPPRCEAAVDLALVIDKSGSMKNDMADARALAIFILEQFELSQARAAVVSFSSSATLLMPLSSDRAALYSAIEGITAGGYTHISEAFEVASSALTQEAGSGRPRILWLLSDGVQSDTVRAPMSWTHQGSRRPHRAPPRAPPVLDRSLHACAWQYGGDRYAIAAAQDAHAAGVSVFAAGFADASVDTLDMMASDPKSLHSYLGSDVEAIRRRCVARHCTCTLGHAARLLACSGGMPLQ